MPRKESAQGIAERAQASGYKPGAHKEEDSIRHNKKYKQYRLYRGTGVAVEVWKTSSSDPPPTRLASLQRPHQVALEVL